MTRSRSSLGGGGAEESMEALDRRVAELEREVTQCRQANRRLAELADVVTEFLVPATARDDTRVAKALTRLEPPQG